MIFSRAKFFGAVLLLAMGLPAKSEAQLRVGVVDINRVFQTSAKAKEAEAKLNEARKAATTEFNERADAYKKAVEEVNQLNTQLEGPALSAEAKAAKTQERDAKIATIRTMEREITQFRQTRNEELQQQTSRAKEQIVREITGIVLELVKTKRMDLVFDKSGASFNGFSPILFARPSDDFTDEVVAALKKADGAVKP
jgi:Skp family chaperone for outer membrane proteins